MVSEEEWQRVWAGVVEIAETFPDGVAFIGGVAVFCHLRDQSDTMRMATYSHDADLVITASDFMDLKEVEAVVSNRRLEKHQFVKRGIEFDVYAESRSGLIVPVVEVLAHSEIRHGIRVACLEHLLVLKLAAYLDRRGSSKGEKDEDDLARLLYLTAARNPVPARLYHLDDDKLAALRAVAKGPAIDRLSHGNAHIARQMRQTVSGALKSVEDGIRQLLADAAEEDDDDDPDPIRRPGM